MIGFIYNTQNKRCSAWADPAKDQYWMQTAGQQPQPITYKQYKYRVNMALKKMSR